MHQRITLFTGKNPYVADEGVFLDELRRHVRFHVEHCSVYALLLKKSSFTPEQVAREEDVHRIPPLTTLYLKRNRLLSMPERKLLLQATSSGTRGSVSRIGFDCSSMLLGLAMAARMFAYHGLISLRPAHYIILGYEPSKQSDLGAMKSAYGASWFAPALSRTYALKSTKNGYVENQAGVKNALLRIAKSNAPVRFIGFPAYFAFLLRELEKDGIALALNPHSRVLLGGGWKQFTSEAFTLEQLQTMVKRHLGIPKERIHEFFSAAEHPLAYCKCSRGRFHIPAYSRVIIRDTHSLESLAFGEAGLLNFVSPLVKSMPLVSVMTDDLATLHEGETCGCGIQTPYFVPLGRAGVRSIQTCSAVIAERGGEMRGK